MKVSVKARTIGTSIVAEHAHISTGNGSPATVTTSVRALLLAANPPSTTRLRLDEETRSIDEAIRRGKHRDRFELSMQWAVRIDDLPTHLMRYRPDILHFAGHANSEGLIFEDASGHARLLQFGELRPLLDQFETKPRCVVLNACFTMPAAVALAEVLPCVVGISRPLADVAAIAFATGFYEALSHGECVRTAFHLGLDHFTRAESGIHRDIGASGDDSRAKYLGTPVLLGRSDPLHVHFF